MLLLVVTTATVVVIAEERSLTLLASSYSHSSAQLRNKPQPTARSHDEENPRLSRSDSCSEAEAATARVSNSLRRQSRYGAGMTARLNISYEDVALCTRYRENVHRLFEDATSRPSDEDSTHTAISSNSRLLARKALRYRNLLERVRQADMSDSTFDVADFCGITRGKRTEGDQAHAQV